MGWLWGTGQSVALKVAGIALIVAVSVGGAVLGAVTAPRAAQSAVDTTVLDPSTDLFELPQLQQPRQRGIIGVVTRRQGDWLLVRTAQGKLQAVHIGNGSAVRRGKQRAAATDIAIGDRVAVLGVPHPNTKPPYLEAKVVVAQAGRATVTLPAPPAVRPTKLTR